MEQWPVKGIQLITGYPDDAIRDTASDNFTAIVGHPRPRIDDMGLMEALDRRLLHRRRDPNISQSP